MISTSQLLSGKPVKFEGVGTLVPPTLERIFDCAGDTDTTDKYLIYLNILQMNIDTFLQASNLQQFYNTLSVKEKEQFTLYKFLTVEKSMRSILIECFSFFIAETIIFNELKCEFYIFNGIDLIGKINEENFNLVRFNILRINCISSKELKPLKFKNKKAREIYEKCQQGRAELEKAKSQGKVDSKYSLDNLVAYVATKSFSYNFENIWNLTIYQFQEVFHRLNLYNQMEAHTRRWSTWGKEPFDFSSWYHNMEILK